MICDILLFMDIETLLRCVTFIIIKITLKVEHFIFNVFEKES